MDGCKPMPEDCTNGVDDNCDGLIDCADPECATMGYTCVPTPPGGWDVAPLDPTAQPGCPPDLKQTDVAVDPTVPPPPADCGCTCSLTAPPSCEQGNITVKAGPDNTCGAGSATYPASGGACNMNANVTVLPFAQIVQPAPGGGTCMAQPTTTLPPNGSTPGEICNAEKAFGGGCAAGMECAHVPTGYQTCIHHGGANMACPAGPYVDSHAVGKLQDTRGCSACTCAAPTCSEGNWEFFTNGSCSTPVALSLAASATCDPTGTTGAGLVTMSNKFTSVPNACASPVQPTPTGTVQLNMQDTICCE
jgi:hypothetical protein